MQKVKEMLSSNKDESHHSHATGAGATTSGTTTGAHGNQNTLQNPAHNTDLSSVTGHPMGTMTDAPTTANTNPRTGDGIHTSTHGNDVTGANSGLSSTGYNTGSTGSTGSHLPAVGSGSTGHSAGGLLSRDHKEGHDHSIATKFDPTAANTHHDHKHLQHVVHKEVRHQEIEEVERQREVERHVHHVQHHVQPVQHKTEAAEVIRENIVPQTKIHEKHASTTEDHQLFSGLAAKHKNTEVHAPKERTVVDLGEKVHETVHHHVHHVTQPVVEQTHVERERIKTIIPTHHVTHEAPIVHKSSVHEPVSMDAFLHGGGKLDSAGVTHDKAGVLNSGEDCSRSVDGVGEKLAQELNLRTGTHSGTTSGTHHDSSVNRI